MSNEKRPLVVKRQLDQIKKHLNKPAEAPSPRPTAEEVETVDEARVKARISLKAPKDWKPKAEKTAAAPKPKKEVSSSESDSEAPGIYGQLLKHKDLRGAPKIKFENGQSHEVSPAHRDKVLDKFRSLHGAGKSPDARDKIIKHAGASHENFMQHVNNTYTPEKRHPMSAVKEDQDTVEKLQAALDAGILSQNDFDKLTQIDELSSNLLNRAKEATYAKLDKTDVNIYPTPNQLKKVQGLRKQGQKFKDAANAKTQSEEVEAVDEKALVGKQKKLDKNHNGKLDAQDFKMIRKEETVAEEAQTPAPERHYVTPATEANRFRGVESSIREIMSQNRDIRKIAKEEEFNRNK